MYLDGLCLCIFPETAVACQHRHLMFSGIITYRAIRNRQIARYFGMLGYNLHHLLRREVVDSDFSYRNQMLECDALSFLNNLRSYEIHCVNLVWKIAHFFEHPNRMQVDEDICVVDYYLHSLDELELAFDSFNGGVQQSGCFRERYDFIGEGSVNHSNKSSGSLRYRH